VALETSSGSKCDRYCDQRKDGHGEHRVPAGPGTFPTHGLLFSGLLVSVILIVGALTFFPALSLGPVAEHFVAAAGKVF